MKAVKEKADGKVTLIPPYLADDKSVVYVTLSKYFLLNGKDSVASVDVNLQWEVYSQIIEDMDFLSHYFIVDVNANSLIHSKINPKYLRGIF